jgi:hypothetical protein
MCRLVSRILVIGFAVVALPSLAAAQASISGLVQDTSGGVLPGVAVEVSSPALIERTRSVITDSAGRYSIVDLRPGQYAVTFSLTGFATVRRDGIVLAGTFDAQVNADLKVGNLQETVTVSGASPVVDVKNTVREAVLTKEQIEVLPGSRTVKGRAALIPGVVIPGGNTGAVAHGSDSQDSHTMVDGFKSGQHLVGRGTGQLGVGSVTQTQEAAIEELVYSTDSQGAEYEFSGVRMNLIPKEGGNQVHVEGIAYGSNQHFERNNLGDLQNPPTNLKYAPQLFFFDFNPVIGGPIKENKLWYFGSVSGNRSNSQILDVYFKPDEPSTPENCRNRTPDNLCQADTGAVLNWSETIRVTHQLSSKQKLRYSFDNTRSLGLRGNYITSGAKASPEASWRLPLYPAWLAQVKYTAPITNRLLIEGGYSYQRGDFQVLFQPENAPYAMAKWDLLRGTIEENHYLSYSNTEKKQEAKAAVAYVTGSHSLKVGFTDRWATALQANPFNGDMSIRYTLDGAPYLVTVTNGPSSNLQAIHFDGGVFAQDQWRLRRFTINLGVRWDHFNAGVPAQTNPASDFTPAVSIDEMKDTPNWNDWATRTGVAWDVFGTGKNGRQGVRRPVRRRTRPLSYFAVQPDLPADRYAILDRLESRRTRDQHRWNAAVRGDRTADQRKVRDARGDRPAGSEPRSRQELDLRADRAARALPARIGERGLLPPPVFRPGVHGQSGDDGRRLDSVHVYRTGGPTVGQRRRRGDHSLQSDPGQGWREAEHAHPGTEQFPDVRRVRGIGQLPAAEAWVCDGQPDLGKAAHQRLRSGKPEQPALL